MISRVSLLRGRAGALAVVAPALPAAVVAWVVAAASLLPAHALTGIHSYTGNGYDDSELEDYCKELEDRAEEQADAAEEAAEAAEDAADDGADD